MENIPVCHPWKLKHTNSLESRDKVEVWDNRGKGFYKGYKIQCVGKLHQLGMEMLNSLNLGKKRCLDLGAGSGAFSIRLKDNGFHVECGEIESLSLENQNIKVHQIDLNSNFSTCFHCDVFNVITCLEVIEHLENAFNFFRQCNRLLSQGGYLLLSCPNIESWMARLLFLYSGRLPWFGEKYYRSMGHLIPHFSWQVPLIAAECGFN